MSYTLYIVSIRHFLTLYSVNNTLFDTMFGEMKQAAEVAERPKPWSAAEGAVALRLDHPRAAVLVRLLG